MPTSEHAPLTEWLRRQMAADLRADGIDPTTVDVAADAPILWSGGTGGVSHAILLRLADGTHRWWVHDDIARPPVIDILRERLTAYESALAATRRLLAEAEAAGAERIWDAAAAQEGPTSEKAAIDRAMDWRNAYYGDDGHPADEFSGGADATPPAGQVDRITGRMEADLNGAQRAVDEAISRMDER